MPFKGITKLRSIDEFVELAEEPFLEWQKCSQDPIYFIKTYFHINSIDEGMILFRLYPYQEDLIRFFHDNRFPIGRIPRQMGKSSVAGAFMLWHALFHKEKMHVIASSKMALAKQLLRNMKDAYQELPLWLQAGLTSWDSTSIGLGNGSRIECTSSISGISGFGIDFLYMDEFAYFNKRFAEDLISSVLPTIASSSTSRFIIASSTKGRNHFYEVWDQSVMGKNPFSPIRLYWHQVPGRDESWALKQIQLLGQKRFDQEFNCDFLV